MISTIRRISFPVAVSVVLGVFLSSCASTGVSGSQVGNLSYDYKERQIINQARGVGAVAGGAAGYAIARNNSSSDASRVGGALLGAAAGALAGDLIGKAQADKARQLRLDNNSMQKLINSVRADNARLVSYNREMKRRIAEIRKAEAGERAKLAKPELASANRAIKATDKLIKRNESDAAQLAGPQRQELISENRKAKSQRQVLVSHRDELASLAAR